MEQKYIFGLYALLTLSTVLTVYSIFSDADVPEVPEAYWGKGAGDSDSESTAIVPFEIRVEEKVLTDLRARLKVEVLGRGRVGVGAESNATVYLQKLTKYWLDKYDWRQREKGLNKYPQYKTRISGLEIHFQMVQSRNHGERYNKTRPLLLLHGWPSSFVEFQGLIPLLTEPEDSEINFEVIIPSLPGFGFSEASQRPGLGAIEMAPILLKLMKRLGHNKFYVHGGDWGATIASHMASLYHSNIVGIHLSNCQSNHPVSYLRYAIGSVIPFVVMDSEETSDMQQYYFGAVPKETAYAHLQASKANSIRTGLSVSPSALAAFFLEKLSAWSTLGKEDGGWSMDDLLDNVMIYWTTNTLKTSMSLYTEQFTKSQRSYNMDRVSTHVPTSCSYFPNDIFRQAEGLIVDKFTLILRFTKMSHGGHFPATHVSDLLAQDILTSILHLEHLQLADFEKKHTCKIGGPN